MKLNWFLIVTAFLLVIPSDNCIAQLVSPMNPHRRPETGPWFEGWYTRITGDNGRDSIGVVTSSFYQSGQACTSAQTPGYIAIVKRNHQSGKLDVYEYFPQRTKMTGGQTCCRSQHPTASFRWEAEGIGYLTEREVSIRLPGGTSLKAEYGRPKYWDMRRPDRGPEGVAAFVRALRSHWYVYSLATKTNFQLTTPDGFISGSGFAHQEKNWGSGFPKAFVWAQGSSPDGRINFALAGGLVPMGRNRIKGWLFGLRTPCLNWDFRPQVAGTTFRTCIDSRNGKFSMTAKSLRRTVHLSISAPRTSFSTMFVPTEQGFVHATQQSYSAIARITAIRHGPAGLRRRVVQSLVLDNVALEFGGDYRSTPSRR